MPTLTKGIKQLLAEAEAEITTLTVEEARARHGDASVVFVDIRDIRELYREGKVPDAVHAPRGMLEFWVDPDSPYYRDVFGQDEKTYVLYCQSGWRSALATQSLKRMGMDNVCHVGGGYRAWVEAEGPSEGVERK